MNVVLRRRLFEQYAEQDNKFCGNTFFLRFLILGFVHAITLTAILRSTKAGRIAGCGTLSLLFFPQTAAMVKTMNDA